MSTNVLNISDTESLLAQTNTVIATYKLYNNEVELLYDDDLHSYFIDREGKRDVVPSVTTITQTLNKPALVPWAVKLCAEYLIQKMEMVSFIDTKRGNEKRIAEFTYDLFLTWITEAKRDYKTVAETACDIGHIAHKWLERHLHDLRRYQQTPMVGMPLQAMPELEPAKNCIIAAGDWLPKHHFRPKWVEKKCYSRIYNFAGTFDTVGLMNSCGDANCCGYWDTTKQERVALQFKDWRALVDWKSSKGMYDEYRLQMGAYVQAWEEEFPDQLIDVRFVCKLGKDDGKFAAYLLRKEDQYRDFGAFLGVQTAYERIKEIETVLREEKDVAKMLKRMEKDAENAAKAERKAARAAKKKVN